MDPITQTALGAAVGTVFRPLLGGKAVLWGAVCGALPDADVIVGTVAGDWAGLLHHRSATHSLLVLAAAAPVFGWLGRRWAGDGSWRAWTHLSAWALITHTLLDWCTSYGTQLMWPVSSHRFAIDAVAVIDPAYTLPLLLAVLWNLKRSASATKCRALVVIALCLTTAYLGFGFWQSQRTKQLAAKQLRSEGWEFAEIRAMPTLFNTCVWRINARASNGDIQVGYASILQRGPIEFEISRRPTNLRVQAAHDSRRGQDFLWFCQGMAGATIREEKSTIVILSDLRYGAFTNPLRSPFRAEFVFDGNGNPKPPTILKRGDVDVQAELAELWRLCRQAPRD